MLLLGEITALCASLFWTVSSLSAEVSSKRIGAISLNLWTMLFALIYLSVTLLSFTGVPVPQHLDLKTVSWMMASGLLSYVICNYFLINAYILIGSRFGQLFITLTAPMAAITGWILLDERLTLQECLGIIVTLTGIIISILSNNGGGHKIGLKLPVKGVIFGIIAGAAQGIGLVFGKVGMLHYHQHMPEGLTMLNNLIPLSASYIRVVTGLCGFAIIASLTKGFPAFRKSFHDKKGFLTAWLTATAGPFLGASCALVAMRYSKAGVAATLLELSPILIILPAHFLFKQKIRWIEVLGAIISVFGVSLFFIKF